MHKYVYQSDYQYGEVTSQTILSCVMCVGSVFGRDKTRTLLLSKVHPLLWGKLHHSTYQSTMWLTPVHITRGQHRDRSVIKHLNASRASASWTKHVFMHIFATPWSQESSCGRSMIMHLCFVRRNIWHELYNTSESVLQLVFLFEMH